MLSDRGNGLIYDAVLDVNWLQDANYAKTSGYDADGTMTWDEAKAWAEQLIYSGFDDWRLANTLPINGVAYTSHTLTNVDPKGDVWSFGWDGTQDRGYNIVSSNHEMSYLYYVAFGSRGYFDTAGNYPQPGWVTTSETAGLQPCLVAVNRRGLKVLSFVRATPPKTPCRYGDVGEKSL